MQLRLSAVQKVGLLPGIVRTASEGAAAALTGMAALALATAALASALALAAAVVLTAVCFCSLSIFCSMRRNCCFSKAISASAPDDCARACDVANAPISPTTAAVARFAFHMNLPLL